MSKYSITTNKIITKSFLDINSRNHVPYSINSGYQNKSYNIINNKEISINKEVSNNKYAKYETVKEYNIINNQQIPPYLNNVNSRNNNNHDLLKNYLSENYQIAKNSSKKYFDEMIVNEKDKNSKKENSDLVYRYLKAKYS